jgi:hypothetical protein
LITVRDLVQTDDQPGTLGYTDARDVYNELSGTVTWLPATGAVIRQDGLLYRVDGNGVYLFDGEEPMYRGFTSGMSDGRDVGELNRDLRAMRYDSGEAIDMSDVDHFQSATGDAIDRWQKAHGLDQTGELDLGRVVLLPGARRIETVGLSVGGPATSSTAGGSATGFAGSSSAGSTGSSGGSGGTAASYERSGAARTVAVSFVRVTSTATTPMTNTLTTTTASTTTATPSTSPSSTTTPTTSTTTTTATTPAAATVPNVTGDRARAATSALITARFTVVEKTKRVTDKGLNGVVLHQRPAGGAIVNEGSAVTITVGRYYARSQTGTGTSPGTTTMHWSPGLSRGGGGNTWAGGAGAAGGAGSLGAGASGAGVTGGAGTWGAGANSSSASSPASNVALVTTSTDMVVTVQLAASSQTEAVVGERVYVTLPSNAVAQGVITQVGRVAQTSSQSSGGGSSPGSGGNSTSGAGSAPQATIPVTISLRHARRLGSLDQAPVTVAFALTTTRNALSIPVSALLATAGGGYAVDVIESTGAVSRVPVRPGSFAGGFVQISGSGIAAGMHVRDTAGG